MKRLKITFETGDIIFAVLNEKSSPESSSMIWDSLPIESEVMQSRWSGREVNLKMDLENCPPRENQTIYTSIGELCYWRNWRFPEDENSTHVLGIYYGAEKTRSHFGEEPVNVIGQIEHEYFDLLKEIGERVWLKGTERIKIEKVKSKL